MRIVIKVGTSTLTHSTGLLNIKRVEKKTQKNGALDGQLTLDFRPEKKRRRRRTKEYW